MKLETHYKLMSVVSATGLAMAVAALGIVANAHTFTSACEDNVKSLYKGRESYEQSSRRLENMKDDFKNKGMIPFYLTVKDLCRFY